MSKLKALLLTQGMHGMISQVEGLAKALNLNYKHQEIKLKSFWNFIPPSLTPISMSVLESQFIFDSKVVISCGRKSVIPSLALKKKYKDKIFNAGSICIGKYSPMALSDYAVGTNHVLPTNASAKFSSGLSLSEFYKKISLITLSKKGVEKIGEYATHLAEYEELKGHALSIKSRINKE